MKNSNDIDQYRDEAINETVNLIIEELQKPMEDYITKLQNKIQDDLKGQLQDIIAPIMKELDVHAKIIEDAKSGCEKNHDRIKEFDEKHSSSISKIININAYCSILLVITSLLGITNLILLLK